ncbi:TetR/AcrR family transcriptional regulator [Bacillus salipaludis]|uniref:TetR/AcrR family transcriptional regulator n=1 Tax=Bacillus salipaludis TaxID=2547811 RepID=A0A4R5VM25_9BACI|nr:TetR/AcrR family transcriptional regulator [Bacillus salipaludis]MDQ6596083.1 TetR/AcrR family transcriptional regulator [Bacillus salipaludis]TDK59140.1 TetR/AcrR family transcriptional regulator [Bacillus salipaludis]
MKDGNIIYKRIERRDAAENRQRILDTASSLFEQFGVEQVSMNQIASEAQIGPGTLYRRYRNKGEICLDLIKDNVVLCFEDMEAYLEENQKEPPSKRLRGILSIFIRFRESKSQLLKGVEVFESAKQSKSGTPGPLYHELHQYFVGLFDEMAATKEGKPNNVFRADMLLAAIKSDSYLFQREVRGYLPEEILELIWATFI